MGIMAEISKVAALSVDQEEDSPPVDPPPSIQHLVDLVPTTELSIAADQRLFMHIGGFVFVHALSLKLSSVFMTYCIGSC